MFGRMVADPIVQLTPNPNLETAVAALLQAAETPEVVRWIEFPSSVLLFLFVPEDQESGAVYVLDRAKGTWYWVCFEDQQYGGYSIEQFEILLRQCGLLSLVEQPWLLRSNLPWVLQPGKAPEARV